MASTAQIQAWIVAAATQYGVDPSLALAVAQQESGFNPSAISSAGAIGVMQLMPATAAQLGVTNPMDPQQNISGGVRYLSMLLSEFGDPVEAVAAYDWGPGNVSNAIAANGSAWLATAPAETQNYVQRILGITPTSYLQMQPGLAPAPAPPVDDFIGIDVTGTDSGVYDPEITPAPSQSLEDALPWILVIAGGAAAWAAAR